MKYQTLPLVVGLCYQPFKINVSSSGFNTYDRPSKNVQKKCFPHFSVIHTRALGVKFPVK
jgi:hypothetical protein